MFFCYKEKKIGLNIFCQKLPFLPQNPQIFFLKSKNVVLEILLKSNILCTKILGTVKFFLKSKNFLKWNVLKSKIHSTKKHGGGGCQKSRKNTNVAYEWSKGISPSNGNFLMKLNRTDHSDSPRLLLPLFCFAFVRFCLATTTRI